MSRQYGPTHKSVSKCLFSLASLCLIAKDCNVTESVKYSEKALSIDDSLENKAIHYSNLGNKHYSEGNIVQAENYYFRATKILEEAIKLDVPGADRQKIYLWLATLYSNLGGMYHYVGDYKLTKFFFNKSIEIYRTFTGPHQSC